MKINLPTLFKNIFFLVVISLAFASSSTNAIIEYSLEINSKQLIYDPIMETAQSVERADLTHISNYGTINIYADKLQINFASDTVYASGNIVISTPAHVYAGDALIFFLRYGEAIIYVKSIKSGSIYLNLNSVTEHALLKHAPPLDSMRFGTIPDHDVIRCSEIDYESSGKFIMQNATFIDNTGKEIYSAYFIAPRPDLLRKSFTVQGAAITKGYGSINFLSPVVNPQYLSSERNFSPFIHGGMKIASLREEKDYYDLRLMTLWLRNGFKTSSYLDSSWNYNEQAGAKLSDVFYSSNTTFGRNGFSFTLRDWGSRKWVQATCFRFNEHAWKTSLMLNNQTNFNNFTGNTFEFDASLKKQHLNFQASLSHTSYNYFFPERVWITSNAKIKPVFLNVAPYYLSLDSTLDYNAYHSNLFTRESLEFNFDWTARIDSKPINFIGNSYVIQSFSYENSYSSSATARLKKMVYDKKEWDHYNYFRTYLYIPANEHIFLINRYTRGDINGSVSSTIAPEIMIATSGSSQIGAYQVYSYRDSPKRWIDNDPVAYWQSSRPGNLRYSIEMLYDRKNNCFKQHSYKLDWEIENSSLSFSYIQRQNSDNMYSLSYNIGLGFMNSNPKILDIMPTK